VFEGNIPSELGLLIQLRDQLDLSYNRLSGPIPSELGRLVELRKYWNELFDEPLLWSFSSHRSLR
jgi:hypothetical protein